MKKNSQSSMGWIGIVLALGFAALSAMLGVRLYQVGDSAPVATVNGDKITKHALYERMVEQGGSSVVSRMIDELLLSQEAKRQNVSVSDSDIAAEIAKIKERIGGEERFQMTLLQYGVSEEQLKVDLRFGLLTKKLIMKDVTLSDDELKTFFEEFRFQYQEAEQVQARHILVKTEEEAKAIKSELDGGADFAKMAAEKSEDKGSGAAGGDLGFFGKGDMVPEFEQVAFSLEKGKISEPVKSDFGYHIIQVMDKKAAKDPTFEEAKARVTEDYTDQKVEDLRQPFMESLRAKANITNTFES